MPFKYAAMLPGGGVMFTDNQREYDMWIAEWGCVPYYVLDLDEEDKD